MEWIYWGGVAWIALAFALGLFIGRVARLGDRE